MHERCRTRVQAGDMAAVPGSGVLSVRLPRFGGLFVAALRGGTHLRFFLLVIVIMSLLGGGYGFRSGNTVLGAGGGVIGLVLLILLILALLGRVQI